MEKISPLAAEVKLVGKHSLIYVIGTALSQAVGFLMVPVYTHYIEPKNYGSMELINIIAAAIAIIVLMGISEGMARFYYGEKDEAKRPEIVSTAIIGFSLMAIPIILFFLMVSGPLSIFIYGSTDYNYIMKLSIITIWFSLLCELGLTYLRMKYMAKIFVFTTVTQLIIAVLLNIFFVVYLEFGILGIFYSTLLTRGLIGTCLVATIIWQNGYKISIPLQYKLIKFGLPLVPSRIATMLGFLSNRFFLQWVGHSDPTIALVQVGLYSLGHKFGVVVNRFVNTPFNSFWNVRKLEILMSEKYNSKEIVARICTYAMALSLFAALILSMSIESLLEIISDVGYHDAHTVVPYIALSYSIFALDTHFTTGIIIEKKTKILSYISLVTLVINLMFNYFLIPKYFIIGAAVSTLLSFLFRMVITFFISQRNYYIPYEIYRLLLLFLIAIFIFIFGHQVDIGSKYLDFIFKCCLSLSFPFVLFLFGFFRQGEIFYLKTAINQMRS